VAGWNGNYTWGTGAWGIGQVDVSVNLTGQSLTTNLDNVTVNANANVNVTGQLLSTNLDNVTVTADANVNVTGELLSANLDNVTVTAMQMLM
jgi:hypothetical protein